MELGETNMKRKENKPYTSDMIEQDEQIYKQKLKAEQRIIQTIMNNVPYLCLPFYSYLSFDDNIKFKQSDTFENKQDDNEKS
jgi:hypothetical protein